MVSTGPAAETAPPPPPPPPPPSEQPPSTASTAEASEPPHAPPPASIVIEGDVLDRLRVTAAKSGLTAEKFIEQVLAAGGPKRDPVPYEPTNVDEMYRYARMLAGASLLPRAYYDRDDKERKQPKIADVHFVLLKGQQLGLHPMVAISTINIIDGKAEVGAQLMVALCNKSGLCEYFEMVASDERSATFATRRRGGRREITFTYTIEEADQMGLLDKGKSEWAKENNQWRKQPRTMLRRRAQSMLAREVYPDVVMGLYDHDEIGELRERERALGIDPDRVIAMNGIVGAESDGVPTALPTAALPPPGEKIDLRAPSARGETVPVKKADPLKERLKGRVAAQTSLIDATGAPVLAPGEVFCKCGVPVEGKQGDLCDACKRS